MYFCVSNDNKKTNLRHDFNYQTCLLSINIREERLLFITTTNVNIFFYKRRKELTKAVSFITGGNPCQQKCQERFSIIPNIRWHKLGKHFIFNLLSTTLWTNQTAMNIDCNSVSVAPISMILN